MKDGTDEIDIGIMDNITVILVPENRFNVLMYNCDHRPCLHYFLIYSHSLILKCTL